MTAVICVFTRPEAINTSNVTTGIAAAIVETTALPNGS
jgi:hypothetical protein